MDSVILAVLNSFENIAFSAGDFRQNHHMLLDVSLSTIYM